MSVVQIFDQTIPYVSGYSMRSNYITNSLTRLGVKLTAVRSPIFNYASERENIDNVDYVYAKIMGWNYIKKFPLIKDGCVTRAIRNMLLRTVDSSARLINAHSSVLNGIAGQQAARCLKVPFVYEVRALWEDAAVDQGKTTEGSLRYNLTRAVETDIIRKADHITVICEGLKKDIIGRGISEDKITVVPNGVDSDFFQPQAKDETILKKYDLGDSIVIGFIGTFFLFEGLEMLIKAAPKILSRNPSIKFLLVGGGREEQKLKHLAQELGLDKQVIFTGKVPHSDIQKYYSVLDICVYPRISKRITELVTPLKPLEAMALEKVVIGSDVGGIKELVKNECNGLLFQAGNVDDLVEKCFMAINNSGLARAMARRAREFVVTERNWHKICRSYLDIFKLLGAL